MKNLFFVYVIGLDLSVLENKKFLKKNPQYIDGNPQPPNPEGGTSDVYGIPRGTHLRPDLFQYYASPFHYLT